MVRVLQWLVISVLATILTVIAHELAHYGGALAFGAGDLRLHWADITFDEASLSNAGTAVTWLAGPALTHGLILWVLLARSSNIWLLAVGLGACSRNLVLLPFTTKFLLGRDTSTFSNDEVTAAQALQVSPVFFAGIAVVLGVVGTSVFLRRAHRSVPYALPTTLLVGTVLGIVIWSIVGPVVLPGGKGIG
ncbi:MAG: hypothetical protein AAGH17_03635 [Pseudomonadota bacterium]